jgi:SEFIR domain/NB-ARC domain
MASGEVRMDRVAERSAVVAVCKVEHMEVAPPTDQMTPDGRPWPPRVFISYAHDSDDHLEAVRDLWILLCENGVDARIDRVAAEQRQDWTLWMEEQVAAADRILVVASPAYKQRAGHEADPDQGRGVQYEARMIRNLFYANQSDLQRFLPVVLPGGSTDDVPTFLSPAIATVYQVSAFTVLGAESLLRVLHGLPGEVQPTIGPAPDLQTREHTLGSAGASTIQGASTKWPVQVGLVPLLADCFQERPEIELLREAVRSGGTAVVTQVLAGLGGVGKSQLAAAFAHERAPDVDVLVWVDARSRQSVIAGFARAATRLGLQVSDADEAAQLFLVWLRSSGERTWLVVLDDVSDPADLQGLWPTGHRGSTVVTTRRTDAALFNRGRQRIAVGLFSPGQARRFIREKLATDEGSAVLDGVDLLVEDLQFLPLALAQAAAFILDRSETCADYRRRFADRQRMLAELFPADALADDYQATVATTWAISIDAADTLAPAGLSRPLLESANLLNPNGFAVELLETADIVAYLAAHAPHNSTVGPRNLTASDCRDALTNLARLSLVSVNRTADGAFVSVHALVQRATLQHLDTGRRPSWPGGPHGRYCPAGGTSSRTGTAPRHSGPALLRWP